MLNSVRLEKHVKGFSNRNRINIMLILEKKGPLALVEIAHSLKLNLKTASDHTLRLQKAGMIVKKRRKNYIVHSLNPRGRQSLQFLKDLD